MGKALAAVGVDRGGGQAAGHPRLDVADRGAGVFEKIDNGGFGVVVVAVEAVGFEVREPCRAVVMAATAFSRAGDPFEDDRCGNPVGVRDQTAVLVLIGEACVLGE
jgi:hypothetical protein